MGVEPNVFRIWTWRLNRFTHPQFFYSPLFGGQHNQIININVITIGINPSVSNVLLLPRWLFLWRWGESNPRLDSNAIKSFTSLVSFFPTNKVRLLFYIYLLKDGILCFNIQKVLFRLWHHLISIGVKGDGNLRVGYVVVIIIAV